MLRYIDAETALKIIDSYAKTVTADGKVVVDAIRDIVGVITPTADVVKQVLMDLKTAVYNKAVYPNRQGDHAFINLKVLGGILQNLQRKYEVDEK